MTAAAHFCQPPRRLMRQTVTIAAVLLAGLAVGALLGFLAVEVAGVIRSSEPLIAQGRLAAH